MLGFARHCADFVGSIPRVVAVSLCPFEVERTLNPREGCMRARESEALQRALELEPGNADILIRVGYSAAQLGRTG